MHWLTKLHSGRGTKLQLFYSSSPLTSMQSSKNVTDYWSFPKVQPKSSMNYECHLNYITDDITKKNVKWKNREMDTLKRYGSLRLSKRKSKRDQVRQFADQNDQAKVEPGTGNDLLPEPKFYATLGRKQKAAKAFFTISFKDVVVSTLNGYQPTHLKAIFERHRQSHSSGQVLWEPSLRCTSTGRG